jgi:hypothetical protein
MTFSNYLKGQFIDFVDCYKKYFWNTLGATLTFTILCLLVMTLLLKFSNFDVIAVKRQYSLLSYFFSRYSNKETYSFVDLGKTFFIFFVALFSLGLTRITAINNYEKQEYSFSLFIKQIVLKDIISLLGILLLCSVIDFGLFRLDSLSESKLENHEFQRWFHSILFQLRIYLPLILFSIVLYKLTTEKILKLNFKKVIFLYVSLWFFNEFAYEISLFARSHIFGLLLTPFAEERKYLYESFFGLPLIAFYFLGYRSAMSFSLIQTNE